MNKVRPHKKGKYVLTGHCESFYMATIQKGLIVGGKKTMVYLQAHEPGLYRHGFTVNRRPLEQ